MTTDRGHGLEALLRKCARKTMKNTKFALASSMVLRSQRPVAR
jgi:hypothetical protein